MFTSLVLQLERNQELYLLLLFTHVNISVYNSYIVEPELMNQKKFNNFD